MGEPHVQEHGHCVRCGMKLGDGREDLPCRATINVPVKHAMTTVAMTIAVDKAFADIESTFHPDDPIPSDEP